MTCAHLSSEPFLPAHHNLKLDNGSTSLHSNQATNGKTAGTCGTIWQYLDMIDEALTSQQLLMRAKVLVAPWLV